MPVFLSYLLHFVGGFWEDDLCNVSGWHVPWHTVDTH